jgi:type II secretory pathway component PulL
MSANSEWIVYLERYRLAVVQVARGAIERSALLPIDLKDPTKTAETIRQVLDEHGYGGQPVLLALGSSSVVSTVVTTPPSRRALKRAALNFLVEPALPWSVEESVIDHERVGDDRAFVVAAEAEPLLQLVSALQDREIAIASVAPMARLALVQHLVASPALAPRYALLWGHTETVDLWLIEDDRPIIWRWVPNQLPELARALKQIALCEGENISLAGRNLPDKCLASLSELTGLVPRELPPLGSEDPLDSCALQSFAVLGGRRESPIELRRDQLAPRDRHRSIRRELRILQVSVLALMVVLGLALGFQAQRSGALRAEYEGQQVALFQELFPKQRVPVALCSLLESELARLKGIRGESADLPQLTPYVAVLERLSRALPDSLRFRLLEVRIENGQLYLVGQVRAHGDADRIAESLRAAGLDVASPNSHRLEKEGVEFRISARLVPPASQKPTRRPA